MITYLIRKFDLYKHYDQDSTTREGQFKMKELFKGNYKAIKSKYGALILSVEDKKPELAADIANEARTRTEAIAQQFVKTLNLSPWKAIAKCRRAVKIMAILEDSIRLLKSKHNLIEANYQQRVF